MLTDPDRMSGPTPTPGSPAARVEFCGEVFPLREDEPLLVGRDGALEIDDNPYLHRRFLSIDAADGLWWLANVGSRLSATVSDGDGSVQAWLAPGSRLPVVFARTTVRFTAGPTAYELEIIIDHPPFAGPEPEPTEGGTTTIGPLPLTASQKLLIVALAEPVLRGARVGPASLPTSADAAGRLGWTLTKLNRKLDNVCQKLARTGVQGLHGDAGALASNRRARLVEYALAARLVSVEDLALLAEVPGTA